MVLTSNNFETPRKRKVRYGKTQKSRKGERIEWRGVAEGQSNSQYLEQATCDSTCGWSIMSLNLCK
jgi:hypothetical protein